MTRRTGIAKELQKRSNTSITMRVYTYNKVKEVPAGYFILCLTKAEKLQCNAPSLVHTDEIEELWKDQTTNEKFNDMACRLKQEIREKGSARLVINWRSDARYEAVANRFASAKAAEELLHKEDKTVTMKSATLAFLKTCSSMTIFKILLFFLYFIKNLCFIYKTLIFYLQSAIRNYT